MFFDFLMRINDRKQEVLIRINDKKQKTPIQINNTEHITVTEDITAVR